MVDYQPSAQGYALGFDGGATLSSGSSYNFGAVEYGSQVEVQLYRDGQFVESYTLVFTNLPVIELDAATIVDEPKSPGSFTLNAGTAALSVGKTAMGIEFRGSTSQALPKKSFGLELVEDDDPTDEKKIPLLGFRNDGDWILDATYRDASFIRNIVGHDIYTSMRPSAYIDSNGAAQGQAAIRRTQVEVILNELRGNLFSDSALAARFVNYHAAVVPVSGNVINARSRNLIRWPDSGGEGVNDPELGTVEYISNWIAGRMGFLDARIAAQPE